MSDKQNIGPAQPRLQLQEWFSSPSGSSLLELERKQVLEVLPDLFGYHLLQVGHTGDADMLAGSRTLHRAILALDREEKRPGYPAIHGTPLSLPIGSDSVDVVLLPHILEFEANPHEVLREVERVLVPEGHLVITGFNPWSLMGLRRALNRRQSAPWCGNFIGLTRVKDWLALLGLDVIGSSSFYFQAPFQSSRLLERLHIMERLGSRFWPYMGGAYVVTARKRVVTLTPIKPRWHLRRGLVTTGLAEPTTRTGSCLHLHRDTANSNLH